ncbi:MFS transporter [Saccharopolyspora hattusasensis]|uniref:MFS transporter n=1 Tax=Saccharopolyspora hattusasensis TaxID=1128679 RepID=UPI003D99E4F4
MNVHRRTRAIVDRRLLSVLFGLMLISHIDRSNVSFAALDMNQDLGMSSTIFGLAAGIFFIGYAAGGLPHAAILDRFRDHRWLGAMIGLWGLSCMALAVVPNAALFVLFRFLLGLGEAVLIPACYTCLARFYSREDLSGATAKVGAAAATATLIGAPMAAGLLQIDWVGLVGWQWLFLLQGAPAVIIAPFVGRLVPYDPQRARWLPEESRQWLLERTDQADGRDDAETAPVSSAFASIIRMRRVWLLGFVYFTIQLGFWGLIFFLPQIIKAGFAHLSSVQVALVAALPYAVALATMIFFGRTSVMTGDRRWHLVGLLTGSGFALGAAIAVDGAIAQVALAVGIALSFSAIGLYHSVTASTLAPNVRTMGVAMVNGLGLLGGFIGPYLFGWLSESTGFDAFGFGTFAVSLLAGAAVVVLNPRHFPTASPRVETIRPQSPEPSRDAVA